MARIQKGRPTAAQILSRMGGYARAGALTPEARSKIAKYAAEVRWKEKKGNAKITAPKPIKPRFIITSTGVYDQPFVDSALGKNEKESVPENVLRARKREVEAEQRRRVLEDEAQRRNQ